MHGQPSGLRDARMRAHVHMYDMWQANGRMSYMPSICGQGGPHFQSLKKRDELNIFQRLFHYICLNSSSLCTCLICQ